MKGITTWLFAATLAATAIGCTEPTSIVIEPLRVISWAPQSGSFCIETEVTIYATFSADLQEDTITDESFFLLDADGVVASTLNYDAPNFTVRLTPDAPLSFGTVYTVSATTDIRSADKGRLPVGLEASFQTVPRTGCAPGVECSLPSDCDPGEICANIGVCIEECVTDRDCFRGTCTGGSCIPDTPSDGGAGDPGPGDPGMGDPTSGD